MEATFSFVDLAGFTALTETHGDEAAADLISRFVDIAGAAIGDDARIVSIIGDALFLVAPTPSSAVRVMRRLIELIEPENDFPEIRGGLHHGEAAQRGPQFYGHAVNIAARIAGHARGGQVLCSDAIVPGARESQIPVQSLGHVHFKNVREPLELFSLEYSSSLVSDPVDPVCRMRVSPERAAARLTVEGKDYWFCSRECLEMFIREGR